MSHLLQFLDDCFDAAGANEEDAIGQAANNVLGQLLTG
jgi:hypothetical protein